MVHQSILALRFGCRTLSDPSGKKRSSIEFFESIFLSNPVASRKLVTDQVANPRWSLNLEHETWCNPWNRQMASTRSFPDLFRQCLAKCHTIYHMINGAITSGLPVEKQDFTPLMQEFGNYSYHSGLPVD